MMRTSITAKKGFTLVELLISVGIFAVVMIALSAFQRNIFALTSNLQGDLNFELGAQSMLKSFSAEVRDASQSSLGGYPIEEASTSEFIFYSDENSDGIKERIRYFLSGTDLKQGVVTPSGSPLAYNLSSEKISTVLTDVVNGATPIFTYYDSSYTGTSSPLVQPVDIASIRLVKALVLANPDPNRDSQPFTFTTQVSIRNLKDNY